MSVTPEVVTPNNENRDVLKPVTLDPIEHGRLVRALNNNPTHVKRLAEFEQNPLRSEFDPVYNRRIGGIPNNKLV